ncbi:MAG: RDD family protein [Clostridium sp.]|uniref:RDD family protein n=1 Tax=Clostridium sp. TaxID=1506 RepID=UPI003EE4844C
MSSIDENKGLKSDEEIIKEEKEMEQKIVEENREQAREKKIEKEKEELEIEEKVDEQEEEKTKEEVMKEEIKNELREEIRKESNAIDENPSFGKRLFASLLDQAIVFGISALAIVVFSILIGIAGYEIISGMESVLLLIAYIILNILYFPVIESNKGRTIGKRILAIK